MQDDYRNAEKHIVFALEKPNVWMFRLWRWYEPPDDHTEFYVHRFKIDLMDGEYI